MTAKGRGWYGESGRHSQAARGIPSTRERLFLDEGRLIDTPWSLADKKMEHLRDWSFRQTGLWHFGEYSLESNEHFARELEDIIMHLKNSQRRPPGFAKSIKHAKGVLSAWETASALSLEATRQDLHIMMRGRARERRF